MFVRGMVCRLAWLAAFSLTLAQGLMAQRVPDVRVDAGSAIGTAESMDPQIAASGDSAFITWQDLRNGGWDVYFNLSTDGGLTWLPLDRRIDTGSPAGAANSEHPQITVSGDAVFATWHDHRSGNNWDIFFNRSTLDGLNWLASDVQVDRGGDSSFPEIAASGDSVYVTWQDYRSGQADVYFNRSPDAGFTWMPSDTRLNTGSTPGTAECWYPQIAASGGSVYVVWFDARNSGRKDVYCNYSSDRGIHWQTPDIRLNVGVPPGTVDAGVPQVAAEGSSVYVVWHDNRNGLTDIFCNRSDDGGLTWLPVEYRLDTGSAPGAAWSINPQIAVSGNSVFVTWEDDRNGAWDIYFNCSLNRGQTWLPTDVRLDTGSFPGMADSWRPVIAASGDAVFVAWEDYRNGAPDIYLNRSLDGGLTWLAADVRLDTGSSPGATSSGFPAVAASGYSVVATWHDYRNGLTDIYCNIPLGFAPYGNGTAGSAGFVPVLTGSGWAAIGSPVSVVVSNGLGGAAGLLAIGRGPDSKVSIPWHGGTLLVRPDRTVPVTLGGSPGVPGAGGKSLRFTIPTNPALVGSNFNLQGLFTDTGAPGGVSMTNGIETWIG